MQRLSRIARSLFAGFAPARHRLAVGLVASASVSIGLSPRAHGQLCAQLTGGTFTENFNTLANTGANNTTVRSEFKYIEAGSSGNLTYAADNGSSTTGDTYSYGSTGSTDRALGEITSTTVQSTIGACFVNNTTAPITWFAIKYTGEQWRLAVQGGSSDRLDFQYSTDATSLTVGTFIDVNALDFTAPNLSGVGLHNGNLVANRTVFPMTAIEFASPVPPGGTFYIRWRPVLVAGTNTNDGLAIDDFSITIASAPATCPPDVNHDNTVNVSDLLAIINAWGPCP